MVSHPIPFEDPDDVLDDDLDDSDEDFDQSMADLMRLETDNG